MLKSPCMNATAYFGERARLGRSFQRLAGNIRMQLGFDARVEPHSPESFRSSCQTTVFHKTLFCKNEPRSARFNRILAIEDRLFRPKNLRPSIKSADYPVYSVNSISPSVVSLREITRNYAKLRLSAPLLTQRQWTPTRELMRIEAIFVPVMKALLNLFNRTKPPFIQKLFTISRISQRMPYFKAIFRQSLLLSSRGCKPLISNSIFLPGSSPSIPRQSAMSRGCWCCIGIKIVLNINGFRSLLIFSALATCWCSIILA